MAPGARADSSKSIQEEQVNTGQPGSQNGQSVPSQMVNSNGRSAEESSKAWEEEITRMVSKSSICMIYQTANSGMQT